MANETRVRQNSISGIIDNNPLSNSGTTLTSDELVALAAVDATQHMVVVLDPTGAGNGPEIVYVTAHTAASSNATIVRGREGTSGVQHTSVRTWVHAPVASDWPQHLTAATLPSTGGLPYEGQHVYETDTDTELVYNGSAWVPVSVLGAWTAFTPTPTATSGTFTSATGAGTSIKIGRLVVFRFTGTITTVGSATGDMLFTLPYQAAAAAVALGTGRESSTGNVLTVFQNSVTVGEITGTTLASGKTLIVWGAYEAAS